MNTRLDEMKSYSNPHVPSGYHSYAGGPICAGGIRYHLSEQNAWIAFVFWYEERKGHCQVSTLASFHL